MSYLFKHEDRIYDLTVALKDEFGEFARIRDDLLENLRYTERWADEELDDIYEDEEKGEDHWFDFTEDELEELQHECRLLIVELYSENFVIDDNFSSLLGEFDELTVSIDKYNEMLHKAKDYIQQELEQRLYSDSMFGAFNAI